MSDTSPPKYDQGFNTLDEQLAELQRKNVKVAGVEKPPLSLRIRPNSEAAPWVIEEVKKLESTIRTMECHFHAMVQHQSRGLDSDSVVGSCDCHVKAPEITHHKPGCKYRLISERDAARTQADNDQNQRPTTKES